MRLAISAALAAGGTALVLLTAACGGGGSSSAAHPTVSTCAKAIEAHPDSSSWTRGPLAGPCKGLTSTQQDQATSVAYAAGARGTVSSAPSASPVPTGLEARSDITMCAAQIEVAAAGGHDFRGDEPHSPDLPPPCRALDPDQLDKAIKAAIKDMSAS